MGEPCEIMSQIRHRRQALPKRRLDPPCPEFCSLTKSQGPRLPHGPRTICARALFFQPIPLLSSTAEPPLRRSRRCLHPQALLSSPMRMSTIRYAARPLPKELTPVALGRYSPCLVQGPPNVAGDASTLRLGHLRIRELLYTTVASTVKYWSAILSTVNARS